MTDSLLLFPENPPDHDARIRAVDTGESFIVQAPAGSGKTMLLTERFLRLLATVDEPEDVLAITFTKAAVAEMRARALKALLAARDGSIPHRDDDRRLFDAANIALQHANARGWNLLDDPQQLNIATIDALALQIAQRTPLLSRLGPGFAPTEDAYAFYRRAASLTLRSLEHRNSTSAALHATAEAALTLLRHRDNNLTQCAELIAAMLESRDHWGRYFPLDAERLSDDVLDNQARPRLERDLQLLTEDHLRYTHGAITASGIDAARLAELACFASATAAGDIADCAGLSGFPEPVHTELPKWRGLANLLLTNTGESRRTLNYKQGFPSGGQHSSHKQAALEISQSLDDESRAALHQIRELPAIKFSDEEWEVTKALFRLLHAAVLHLKLMFAEAGTVDFTEVSVAARTALEADPSDSPFAPSDLALMLGSSYKHLLVDEFQDTSITQFEILSLLVAGWERGDGRSVFLVGDPLQSIYLFRQAQMHLFAQASRHGLASVPLVSLKLKVNFRSQSALITEHNRMFATVFAPDASVAFASAEAFGGSSHEPALLWHFFRKPSAGASTDEKEAPRHEEASRVRELVQQALKNPQHSIAVLVRAKWHGGLIMQQLRDAGIPYRAIDMESLDERQEVLDVLALTRALLHPADRTAWLSIFRAPWCGLGLASLETLCESNSANRYARPSLLELLPHNLPKLPPDERLRAGRVNSIVSEAWRQRDQLRLPQLVWLTWQRLGGPACCNAEQSENVAAYFALLEKMDAEGQPWSLQSLDHSLKRLFAQPNPDASARVEVLTIHKAKGLGFDVVIVPHLDRSGGKEDSQAMDWLEQPRTENPFEGDPALYVAPIQASGADRSPLSKWVRKRRKQQIRAELKRLLYVSATRARHQLHLLGSVEVRDDATQMFCPPRQDSLLDVAWPAIDLGTVQRQIFLPGRVETIAATAPVVPIRDGQPSSVLRRNQVRRLPDEWHTAGPPTNWLRINKVAPAALPTEAAVGSADVRASAETRARGTVLHALLEQAAGRLERGESFSQLSQWAAQIELHARKLLAAEGLLPQKTRSVSAEVQKLLQRALASPTGQWVLAARTGSHTEFPVTHWEDGVAHSLRMDRVFPAGENPGDAGDTHLWIVDYKSVAAGGRDENQFLRGQAGLYAPAMTRYVKAWHDLGIDRRPIRCALYFPAQDRLEIVPVADPAS